ncbi:HdeD family acid-resistance protein [Actinoallomurus purpureus]|uniref:HdeD family acid-resistance protein n=1 Tax=Actinoallomurus purpureus TaxID=478114 RepID=UPI002091F80B|nr:HdeD family acid-resistance protein [Actinoallomurus purpureus]MCO6007549.1 HdeD family acid-resistance protein [Actinoallomurus purpureus]
MLLDHVARYWWLLALRGALAVLFGVMAVIWPGITLLVLAVVFGAYALVDGIFAVVGAFRAPRGGRSPLVFEAAVGIIFGLIALLWPGITVLAIAILVGLWAIIRGVGEIVTAIQLRKEIHGEWMYVLFGLVSVLFGLLVLFSPVSGVLAVAWLIGFSAIVFGASMIAAGFRLRKLRGGHRPGVAPGGAAPSPV